MHHVKRQKASHPDEPTIRLDVHHLPGWGATLREACPIACGRPDCPAQNAANHGPGWNCGTAACRALEKLLDC